MSTRKQLLARWQNRGDAEILELLSQDAEQSPFGLTEEGRRDFRYMVLSGYQRPENLMLSRYDFSGAKTQSLIFANSELNDCRFNRAHICWGDYDSKFKALSFINSNLRGSGFGGGSGSAFSLCNFTNTNISGSTFLRPLFSQYLFINSNFKSSVVSGASFIACEFAGLINGVIFGPSSGCLFEKCDLSKVAFVDCSFVNTIFNDCVISSDAVILKQWPSKIPILRNRLAAVATHEQRVVCDRWCRVWAMRQEFTPQILFDLQDLRKHFGPVLAEAVFQQARALE